MIACCTDTTWATAAGISFVVMGVAVLATMFFVNGLMIHLWKIERDAQRRREAKE